MQDVIILGLPVLMLLSGVLLVVTAGARARHATARMSAGDDHHFEERRYYQSYPSLRDPVRLRRRGYMIMALAVSLFALLVIAPR